MHPMPMLTPTPTHAPSNSLPLLPILFVGCAYCLFVCLFVVYFKIVITPLLRFSISIIHTLLSSLALIAATFIFSFLTSQVCGDCGQVYLIEPALPPSTSKCFHHAFPSLLNQHNIADRTPIYYQSLLPTFHPSITISSTTCSAPTGYLAPTYHLQATTHH